MTNRPSVARQNTKSHMRWSTMLGILAQGAFGALLGFGLGCRFGPSRSDVVAGYPRSGRKKVDCA
jgi:hypothetical protein